LRPKAGAEAELEDELVVLASRWLDVLCRGPASYSYAAIASGVVERRE
jgi:hypothetical protein